MILAGYGDRMEKFFASNPGFRSCIAHHIDFPDYSGHELLAIAELMLHDMNYRFQRRRARGVHPLHRVARDPAAVLQRALDPQCARPHAAAPGQSPRRRSRSSAGRRRRDVAASIGRAGQPGVPDRQVINPALLPHYRWRNRATLLAMAPHWHSWRLDRIISGQIGDSTYVHFRSQIRLRSSSWRRSAWAGGPPTPNPPR